jgi:DNA end-binding protein Ku
MLRKSDKSPIRYVRVAESDGKEVAYEDIAKGYEYQKDQYVLLSDEDFEKANQHKTRNITIKQFVNATEIDSRYYNEPYYLEPDEHAADTYALLRDALAQTDKVALARYVLHGHESIAAIKPIGKVLVLNQLRFPADLREPSELDIPVAKADKPELTMAVKLISQLTKPFIAEDWHDTYTEELRDAIDHKIKNKPIKAKGNPTKPTSVSDLAQALKKSLK